MGEVPRPRARYVYITHPHADHFLGLPEILAAFPQARPVALAESIPAMEEQISPGYMQVWGGFFPGQLTARPVAPAPLAGTTVPVGGSVATVIPSGPPIPGTPAWSRPRPEPDRLRRCRPQPDAHVAGESTPTPPRQLGAGASCRGRYWTPTPLTRASRNPLAPDKQTPLVGVGRMPPLTCADFEAALERSSAPAELIDRMTETAPEPGEPVHALDRGLRPAWHQDLTKRVGQDLRDQPDGGERVRQGSAHGGRGGTVAAWPLVEPQ